jgi:hypothetical protein
VSKSVNRPPGIGQLVGAVEGLVRQREELLEGGGSRNKFVSYADFAFMRSSLRKPLEISALSALCSA